MNHLASIWHSPRLRRAARLGLIAALVALVLAQPAFAQGGNLNIETQAKGALDAIRTGVRVILIVAVLGSGVLAAFGRMTWSTVGQVVIGTMIAGLAEAVVMAFFGA